MVFSSLPHGRHPVAIAVLPACNFYLEAAVLPFGQGKPLPSAKGKVIPVLSEPGIVYTERSLAQLPGKE